MKNYYNKPSNPIKTKICIIAKKFFYFLNFNYLKAQLRLSEMSNKIEWSIFLINFFGLADMSYNQKKSIFSIGFAMSY